MREAAAAEKQRAFELAESRGDARVAFADQGLSEREAERLVEDRGSLE